MSNPHANHQGEPGDTGTGWALVPASMVEQAHQHAVDLAQCALFVESKPLNRAMIGAAGFLRQIASAPTPPDRVGEEVGRDWLDQPIGGELVFDGMRFGKGVPLRTVIKAAQRWRRDAVAAFNEKVEARKSDGGARILDGLDDALAWAKGDASRGKLVTVKDGKVVDVADPAPIDRDHVVSARLIPWEPGSLGGVDLTFESGLRVALPLSEPSAPSDAPSTTETE